MNKKSYAKEAAKLHGPEKKKKSVPKIKKCMYTGCPLNASTEINGQYRCLFHFSGDFHHEITIAIKQNINFIRAYSGMVKWRISDWKKHKDWLLTKENCPMKPKELPSLYITRSFFWLAKKIETEASILIERK